MFTYLIQTKKTVEKEKSCLPHSRKTMNSLTTQSFVLRAGVLIISLLCCTGALAAIIHVDGTATGLPADGASWATAYTDIQAAVDAAFDGDEIWVAEGVYQGEGFYVVKMKEGVSLYGGFAGNEVDRAMRNWVLNETIIDGGYLHDSDGPSNARRCVYSGVNGTLDGFTIQNGYASYRGGGIYAYSSALLVANCFILGNVRWTPIFVPPLKVDSVSCSKQKGWIQMGRKRRTFSSKFKAKLALEAVRGVKTVAELASENQVHPNQVTTWKKQLVSNSEELFAHGKGGESKTEEELTAPLYEEIGRLKMDIKWLEKKL